MTEITWGDLTEAERALLIRVHNGESVTESEVESLEEKKLVYFNGYTKPKQLFGTTYIGGNLVKQHLLAQAEPAADARPTTITVKQYVEEGWQGRKDCEITLADLVVVSAEVISDEDAFIPNEHRIHFKGGHTGGTRDVTTLTVRYLDTPAAATATAQPADAAGDEASPVAMLRADLKAIEDGLTGDFTPANIATIALHKLAIVEAQLATLTSQRDAACTLLATVWDDNDKAVVKRDFRFLTETMNRLETILKGDAL